MCVGLRTATRAVTRRDVSNPLDDPTCLECPIAKGLRAMLADKRAQVDDLLSELGVTKGTRWMPGVQRVAHGDTDDPPPSTR